MTTVSIDAAELARLQRLAYEFDRMVGTVPDLYFRIGADGIIAEYRAHSVAEMFVPPDTFLGQRAWEMLPSSVASLAEEALAHARQARNETIIEYALPIHRELHYFEMRYIPTEDDQVLAFVRNITDRARAQKDLERSVSLLRATLDATADGILVVDGDGRVQSANRKFAELWGIPDELLERGESAALLDFVGPALVDPERFLARVRELYADPVAEAVDILRFKDGRVFERVSKPQRRADQPDEIVGRVWSFRDVTEQRRAEAERDRLLRRAQAEVRARDEFLSVASHELRTPLTSLHLGLQLLERFGRAPGGIAAASPAHVGTALDTALRQTRVLRRLIEELLSVARLHAGRMELRREAVDLSAIARDALANVREELRRAGCEVRFVAPAPVVGAWDRARLEQVVTNLLTNAARYAAGAPVEIVVEERGADARLAVRDGGPGIPPDMHDRIFERFERAAPASHYGGLGLGLFIVRQLVEAHGGRVAVESEPGRGAAFLVTVPRRGQT